MANFIWPVFWILVVIGILALPALLIYWLSGGAIARLPLRAAAQVYSGLLLVAALGTFFAGAQDGVPWASYLVPALAFFASGAFLLYGMWRTAAVRAEIERRQLWLVRATSWVGLVIVGVLAVVMIAVNSNREWFPVRIVTVNAGSGQVAVVPSPNGGAYLAEEVFGPTYTRLQLRSDEVLATPANQRGLNPNFFGYELQPRDGIFQMRNIWWKPNPFGLFGPTEYKGVYELALERREKFVGFQEGMKELDEREQALTASGTVKRGIFDWDLVLAIVLGALLIAVLAVGAFRPAGGRGAFNALAFILFALAVASGGWHAYHSLWGVSASQQIASASPPAAEAQPASASSGRAQAASAAFARGKAKMCADPEIAARYKARLGCP